jgi:hypothetical protein
MKRHGMVFLGLFVPTATVVATLVLEHTWTWALGAGVVGLLVYWFASVKRDANGELADASYFFGFLLTLTFLAAGLFRLSSATQPASENLVLSFLEELGAGLVLTIIGLLIRQVRTLSAASHATADATNSLTDAQQQLADAMRTLVKALANRPEEIAARELHDTRTRARGAAEQLERNVVQAADRIEASMTKLEEATTQVTSSLLRASSGLGDSFTQSTGRIQAEVSEVLALLDAQRRKIDASLRQAQTTSEATQREIEQRMREQLAEWRATLDECRSFLAATHSAVNEQFSQSVTTLHAAGAAFANLSERVARDVAAMPDPSQRLAGLWERVRSLESTLATSIGATSERLEALGGQVDAMTAGLTRLQHSTGAAAETIERGGEELGGILRRELAQMNEILEQYTALLGRSVQGAGSSVTYSRQ